MSTIEDQVRAYARGLYPLEAAVELLIWGGKAIYPRAPWLHVSEDQQAATIDVEKLASESGVWSSGERALTDIAVSLLGGAPVDLSDAIPSLGRQHLDAVLAALAHAGGSHEHTEIVWDATGAPDGFAKLETLHPWPA